MNYRSTFLDRGTFGCTFDLFCELTLWWNNRSVYPTPSTLTSWLCYGRNLYAFYGGIENKSLTIFGARPKKNELWIFKRNFELAFSFKGILINGQETMNPTQNKINVTQREIKDWMTRGRETPNRNQNQIAKSNWIGNMNIKTFVKSYLGLLSLSFLEY